VDCRFLKTFRQTHQGSSTRQVRDNTIRSDNPCKNKKKKNLAPIPHTPTHTTSLKLFFKYFYSCNTIVVLLVVVVLVVVVLVVVVSVVVLAVVVLVLVVEFIVELVVDLPEAVVVVITIQSP
jgi:Flp pilus assembly protein TadB